MRIYEKIRSYSHIGRSTIYSMLSLCVITMPNMAHDTFLLPSQNNWSVGNSVDVRLTSALHFPDLASGPSKDRISSTVIRIGGEDVDTFSLRETKTFLSLGFTAEQTGFGVIAISTKPRFGDISPENAEVYFDEIGAEPPVRQAFDALPGTPPLRRSYSKHAKSFICVEDCKAGSSARSTPVNQALEFVEIDDKPNSFLLLRDGQPLANHKVKLSTTAKETHEFQTSQAGELTVSGKVSGVVILQAVVITLPAQPDGVYHSDYATLVLEIKAAS